MPNPLKYCNHLKYQKIKIIPKFNIKDCSMGLNYFFRYVLFWFELYDLPESYEHRTSPTLHDSEYDLFGSKDLYRGDTAEGRENAL